MTQSQGGAAEARLSVDLFNGLQSSEISGILSTATVQSYDSSQVIFRAGEPASHLYVIRSGRVKYYRETRQGKEVLLRWLGPGEVFGLGTFLTHPMANIGTAEAVRHSEAHVWDHAAVQRIASQYPRLRENAFRAVLSYIAEYSDRHLRLVADSAAHRLARTVSDLGMRSGKPVSDGVELDIKNEYLSSLADVGLYTASRLLKEWERRGALRKGRGKILIRQPEMLLLND